MNHHAARFAVAAALDSSALACRKEVAPVPPAAPPAALHAAPIDTASIDSVIRATMHDRGLVGVSVGVAQDGKIVFSNGYGVLTQQAGPGRSGDDVRNRLGHQTVHLQRP